MKKYTIYSVDIDTVNGEEIRDFEFRTYKSAKKIFDKYVDLKTYEDVPIENVQLIKVKNNGEWETLESKFYDNI